MTALRERVAKLLTKHNVVLLRHCKTTAAKDASVEADLARVPNDVGKQQCAAAGESWFGKFNVHIVFHSEARRTLDTAKLALGGRSDTVQFVQLKTMYGTNCPEVEKAFTEGGLGYSPLQAYIDSLGSEPLDKYAFNVLSELMDVVDGTSEDKLGTDIAIFSHAVYVSAIAKAIVECSKDEVTASDRQTILCSNVGEVSGFYITPNAVQYLGSTL